MAVPSSGQLTLRLIAKEKRYNSYSASQHPGNNISLTNMSTGAQFGSINTANTFSNRPDGIAPHSMSEWYAYDHDKTIVATPSVGTGTISHSSGIVSMIGNVSSDGGATVTARGHVASSTTTSPTLSNNMFSTTHPSGGTGSYTTTKSSSQILTGPNGTTYNFRAYATNSQGTSYGSTVSFLVPDVGGFE